MLPGNTGSGSSVLTIQTSATGVISVVSSVMLSVASSSVIVPVTQTVLVMMPGTGGAVATTTISSQSYSLSQRYPVGARLATVQVSAPPLKVQGSQPAGGVTLRRVAEKASVTVTPQAKLGPALRTRSV